MQDGSTLDEVCELLNLKKNTLQKALKQGRINPVLSKDRSINRALTKSDRSAIDDVQAIGKACSNTFQRVLAAKTGRCCELKFTNQIDL